MRRSGRDDEARAAAPSCLSLDEANALVPELHRAVSRQMLVQSELEALLERMHREVGELPRDIVPQPRDPPHIFALKQRVNELLDALEVGWARVVALGGAVVDPRRGEIELRGEIEGEPVVFCWRFGDEGIGRYRRSEARGEAPLDLPTPERHRLFH